MKTKTIVIVTLFSSLIMAGAFIALPVGPGGIPIVMQNMFAVLSGMLLGFPNGFFATLLWLLAGIIGLPVFSSARGGISHLLGPTGGFIFGYVISSFVSGSIAKKPSLHQQEKTPRLVLASILGFLIIYIPGVIYFMILTKRNLLATLGSCVFPFIPGDVIKCILTVTISKKLRPIVARYINE